MRWGHQEVNQIKDLEQKYLYLLPAAEFQPLLRIPTRRARISSKAVPGFCRPLSGPAEFQPVSILSNARLRRPISLRVDDPVLRVPNLFRFAKALRARPRSPRSLRIVHRRKRVRLHTFPKFPAVESFQGVR